LTDKSHYIPALSGLRGFAALLVFFSHASHRGLFPDILGRGAGQMGVMLFFTLSAFLMTILYLEKWPSRPALQDFWVARFGRVYPLHFGLLTVGVIAFYLGADREIFPYAIDIVKYLKNVLLVGKFNVFWTISTEFQFYLIFAVLWWVSSKTSNRWKFVWVVAGTGTLAVFLDVYSYPSGHVFKTIQFFAVGLIAGLVYLRRDQPIPGATADMLLLTLLVLFLLSLPKPFLWIMGFEHAGFWSP
jgi:peptidoglycan/LPS O-acetylase OafA/YrhL